MNVESCINKILPGIPNHLCHHSLNIELCKFGDFDGIVVKITDYEHDPFN